MNKYETLNPMQQKAVFHTQGPLLVLAGAGSGKTRVLTHRIAYLIEEENVNPWNIMAITFTNKAAAEMRERVDQIVGEGSESIWVSTFHSSCVKILRRHIEYLGYSTNFTIYDGDDQKTLMKQIFKRMHIDPKQFKERAVLSAISAAKDQLIDPREFEANVGSDFREKRVAQIYKEYQADLKKNNALDFDDLIMKTVELFREYPQVLDYYQRRFRYIMVDEYQDTNKAQFHLVDLLAKLNHNICVVGDDDQSIYKFRGADIENILSFEKAFPGAEVIKLEQNYRSTQNILNAANSVISNNRGRKEKKLWTANEEGSPVIFRHFDTAYEEAEAIVLDIQKDIRENGSDYSDFAVLYRTNAQSRLMEEKCILHSIPYRLVGGVNFYQRKEIKDILSYLKTIANGLDDLAVQRIINVPKRGIGVTSIGRITAFASENGMSFYQALERAKAIPGLLKAGDKIAEFVNQIETFRKDRNECSIKTLIEKILEETGYKKELEAEGAVEAETRLQNIEELINKAVNYEDSEDEPTLEGFLEEVALVAEVDQVDETEKRVILMTLHSAKGLEFPYVYLSGMEDGLFPSSMSIFSEDRDAIEEERRLCYVGITRARKKLTMTAARQRMTNGETRFSKLSRFIEEIPAEYLKTEEKKSAFSKWEQNKDKEAEEDQKTEHFQSPPWGRSSGAWTSRTGKLPGVSAFGEKSNVYVSKTASAAPAFGKSFTVNKEETLSYAEGDRVRHMKFGEGTVQTITDGGKDYEVTVEFDRVGVKKMFASFAKLVKL